MVEKPSEVITMAWFPAELINYKFKCKKPYIPFLVIVLSSK